MVIICIILVVLLLCSVIAYIKQKSDLDRERADKQNEQSAYNTRMRELQSQYDNLNDQITAKQKQDIDAINREYANIRLDLQKQVDACKLDADAKIEVIKKALEYYESLERSVIDGYKEEEKRKLEKDFYRVSMSDIESSDIQKLKIVAMEISRPDVLYKLIYEIYYKTKLDELFKRLIGDNVGGGIYKITNIESNRCYIGRTVNFLDRWREHAKCGVGYGQGAQCRKPLYTEMMQIGLDKFTFEIIDQCSADEQPEREKYWINFYKSSEFGYNVVSGG